MLSGKAHRLEGSHREIFLYTFWPQLEESRQFREEAVIRCPVFARQHLEGVAESTSDPFNYGLLDLWLEAYQTPWNVPRTTYQLIGDLANQIAEGSIYVYREYSPMWEHVSSGTSSSPGIGAGGHSEDATDTPRIQRQSLAPSPPESPHPGLHNRSWPADDGIAVENFRTRRGVDFEDLSDSEKYALHQLEINGWGDRKVREILSSGFNFRHKELKAGDKLYGITSKGFDKDIKSSPYWLDEEGFKDIEGKYFQDGFWNRELVKDELALPCYNRAESVDVAEVTDNQIVVVSEVARATELISYSDSDGSTGLIPKIMSGGGTQIAPQPDKLKKLVNQQ